MNFVFLNYAMDTLCDDVILEIINYLDTISNISLVCKKLYRIVKKSKLYYLAKNIKYINFKIHKKIIQNTKNILIKNVVVKNEDFLSVEYHSHTYCFLNYKLQYLYSRVYENSEELYLENNGSNKISYIEFTEILEENLYLSLYDFCSNFQNPIKSVAILFYNYICPILNYINKITVFETNIEKYCRITDWYITSKLKDIILKKHTEIYEEYINKKIELYNEK